MRTLADCPSQLMSHRLEVCWLGLIFFYAGTAPNLTWVGESLREQDIARGILTADTEPLAGIRRAGNRPE